MSIGEHEWSRVEIKAKLAEAGQIYTEKIPDSASCRDVMHWYWETAGGHTHIRVFMNGGKAGDLCFTNEEFQQIRRDANRSGNIKFHP